MYSLEQSSEVFEFPILTNRSPTFLACLHLEISKALKIKIIQDGAAKEMK